MEYKNGDEIRSLPCHHEFHKSCLDPWLGDNASCPACRYSLSDFTPPPSSSSSTINNISSSSQSSHPHSHYWRLFFAANDNDFELENTTAGPTTTTTTTNNNDTNMHTQTRQILQRMSQQIPLFGSPRNTNSATATARMNNNNNNNNNSSTIQPELEENDEFVMEDMVDSPYISSLELTSAGETSPSLPAEETEESAELPLDGRPRRMTLSGENNNNNNSSSLRSNLCRIRRTRRRTAAGGGQAFLIPLSEPPDTIT